MPRFDGIAASPGCAVGQVWHRRTISSGELPRAFSEVVEQAQQQLQVSGGTATSEEAKQLVATYTAMLADPELENRVALEVAKGQTLTAAVEYAGESIADVMAAASNEYLRARSRDVLAVTRLLVDVASGRTSEWPPPPGSVVVAEDLSPAEAVQLPTLDVAGIVTEIGAANSHLAMLARASGVPLVCGVEAACQLIDHGSWLEVDGDNGVVTLVDVKTVSAAEVSKRVSLPPSTTGSVRTGDGTAIDLLANIDHSAQLQQIDGDGGIGLLRTEFIAMAQCCFPPADEWEKLSQQIVASINGRRVVRLYDFGADKLSHLLPDIAAQTNPALGVRAHRMWKNDEYYAHAVAQMQGLCAGTSDIELLLPFVATREELEFLVERVRASVGNNVKVGVMLEIPSLIWELPDIGGLVDFVSVGTNDLTQYLFAADRQSASLSHYYEPTSPALVRCLGSIAATCPVPVSVCGEMAGDPLGQKVLSGLGFRSLSMRPGALAQARKVLARVDVASVTSIRNKLCAAATAADIRSIVATYAEVE